MEQVEKIILCKNKLRAHKVGFAAFSHAMGNWWEKLCISYLVKYTIGWESDGRKVAMLWGKYGYQFRRLSQFDGFRCIFLCYGNLMGKPICFPNDEVYQWSLPKSSNGKKSTHTVEKFEYQFCRFSPYNRFCYNLSILWEIDEETHTLPIRWSIPQDGTLMEENTYAMEKVLEPISQAFLIW